MGTGIDATAVTRPGTHEVSSPTDITDVHQSKIPPDDPRLRLDRPKARTLKRGPVLLVAAMLAGLLAVGLVGAMLVSPKQTNTNKDTAPAEAATGTPPLPDVIKDPPSPAEHGPVRQGHRGASAPSTSNLNADAVDHVTTTAEAREEDLLKARAAAIFISASEGAIPAQGFAPEAARRSDADRVPAAGPPSDVPGHTPDPNLQERKNDFVARAGVSATEYLDKSVSPARSPYEVKAGNVIPTVLITGINSDLPGQVIAQVRENVYDTVTGNYLLIPQGSRLLAAYDSMVAWGQQRVLVCWNRLIRPDGSSVTLDCMPGVDLGGKAGFSDEVDNHWWRIVGGAAVSSLLAATTQRSQGNVTGYQPTLPQSWASGTAAGINEAGQQLTAKNLQLQPTITIRPGFSVNVLVTKDIVLPPYTPPREP